MFPQAPRRPINTAPQVPLLWRNTLAVSLLLIASVAGAEDYPGGDLVIVGHAKLGTKVRVDSWGGIRRTLDTIEYSNVTNFLGEGFANGGSALQGTNTITTLVADDITPTGANAGQDVTEISFSVANFNAVSVIARPRVRFWFDNSGVPGAYYNVCRTCTPPPTVGFTFNPIEFQAMAVTVYSGTLLAGLFTMPGATFWAGITFDNSDGATGASSTQLDLLGQGAFDPPTVGSSVDGAFQTTNAGSFFATANPVGSAINFSANPVANFGWEFISVTDPTSASKSSWGRIKRLYH